jgi:DNA-binding LytR/AlgR family response regulator
MNIAICEDNAADAAVIQAILEEYLAQNGYAGKIYVFASGEKLLDAFTPGRYGVILLDIYLGELNGIATAQKIRAIDPACALIFITASSAHALESYAVRGSAYVVKPVDGKKMREAMFTCREIFMRNARYIEARVERATLKIPLIKIYYVESYDKYALFHTAAGQYQARMTLAAVEQQTGGQPFYRCHQSYIINTNHVRKLEGNDVVMRNGERVPMRKDGRDEIRLDLAAILSARMFEV